MQKISFASFDAYTLPLFAKSNIIKFSNLISFCDCLFSINIFWVSFPQIFSNVFILTSSNSKQSARSALHGLLTKPSCSTSKYGTNAFAASAIKSWNLLKRKFSNNSLCQLSYSQLKVLIKNHFIISYNQTDFKLRWKIIFGIFFSFNHFICKNHIKVYFHNFTCKYITVKPV